VVSTEVELSNGILTLRVSNQPGVGHAHLQKVYEKGGAVLVFEKGKQLHTDARYINATDLTSSTVSKGDGGWIMRRCGRKANIVANVSAPRATRLR
jgi:hypothetical protein